LAINYPDGEWKKDAERIIANLDALIEQVRVIDPICCYFLEMGKTQYIETIEKEHGISLSNQDKSTH